MQDSNNLLYLRARYYAPGLNSFTSRDSFRGVMSVPMSLNGYSYAHNSPANLTDPGGHFPLLILAVLTGALFGAAAGSVLGGVSETVSQLSNNGWNFNCLVQKDIADAILEGMLLGALSGAVGGAFGYLKFAGAAAWAAGEAIDFAGGYLWDVHIKGYSHQEAFINNLLGFGMGGLIGLIGHGVGRALRPVLRNLDGLMPGLRRYVNPDANAPRVRCNSFSADTVVATPDGNVAISELKLDDLVLAYDEANGEVGAYRVLDIHTHTDEIMVKLTIDGEVIQTTPEHPFFTVERGWIPAGALEVGEQVYAADLTTGVVEAIETLAEPQMMVNLTVETVHTFAVGDGQWVVHNTDACEYFYRAMSKTELARVQAAEGLVTRPDGAKPQAETCPTDGGGWDG